MITAFEAKIASDKVLKNQIDAILDEIDAKIQAQMALGQTSINFEQQDNRIKILKELKNHGYDVISNGNEITINWAHPKLQFVKKEDFNNDKDSCWIYPASWTLPTSVN